MPIVRSSLSEQAFEVVRERVLAAQIEPMTPIRQEALAADLGISRVPLREALARLEQSGLVKSLPNRGFFVPALNRQEAEEVFALRLKIEPDAAAAACACATAALQLDARRALEALSIGLEHGKAELTTRNRKFHLALVANPQAAITAELVERLHLVADRYVYKHLEPEGRYLRADAEHQNLLNAWLAGDRDSVAALLTAHLQLTLEDLRTQLDADQS